MQSVTRTLRRLCLAVAGVTLAASAAAQTTEAWPTKPVTLIAPFTPGGTTDLVARALATQLQTLWSQPVIVDNKPGAGGTVGAALTARAPADGYTLLLANVGHTAAAALYKNLPYEFTTHLESITSVAQVPIDPAGFIRKPCSG